MKLSRDFYKPRWVTWIRTDSFDRNIRYYNGAGWYKRRELAAMVAMGIRRFDQKTGTLISR